MDIAVVGAGAAGLMTAIWAGRTARQSKRPLSVWLFDTREKIGAKILMSGGTRCNVTNRVVTPADFQGGPPHFVKHVFQAFTPAASIRFFKEIGVELVLEPTGKYFPVTHSAETVLTALIEQCNKTGATLKTGICIHQIEKRADGFYLRDKKTAAEFQAQKVVLTTGGLSYPSTGSDGTGYALAQSLGHSLTPTYPALTPLLTEDPDWRALSGVTHEVRLTYSLNEKKVRETRDSFLFTHFGFSGPAALDISRHVASAPVDSNATIRACFLPQIKEEALKTLWERMQKQHPKKLIKSFLTVEMSLPKRLAETLLKKSGLNGQSLLAGLSGEKRKKLMEMLFHCPLPVTGVFGYKKAEVTAGGVNLKEVRVATMESKITPGLYLAGEILEVDGRIGGVNFHWAWCTGAVAGQSAAGSLCS